MAQPTKSSASQHALKLGLSHSPWFRRWLSFSLQETPEDVPLPGRI